MGGSILLRKAAPMLVLRRHPESLFRGICFLSCVEHPKSRSLVKTTRDDNALLKKGQHDVIIK